MTSRDEILYLPTLYRVILPHGIRFAGLGCLVHLPAKRHGQIATWIFSLILRTGLIFSISSNFPRTLEEKIGRHVDLATPRALRPEIRDGVYRDVVYA